MPTLSEGELLDLKCLVADKHRCEWRVFAIKKLEWSLTFRCPVRRIVRRWERERREKEAEEKHDEQMYENEPGGR